MKRSHIQRVFPQITAVCCVVGSFTHASLAGESPGLSLKGAIQIQAQKMFHENAASDNLDQFWGRAVLGVGYSSPRFSSLVNIMAFPEGFGYEPIFSVNFKDSTAKVRPIDRFVVEQAWVQFGPEPVGIKVGRTMSEDTRSRHFGNYLDRKPGGGFHSRKAYHNALEFLASCGPVMQSIMLRAGDDNLNTGDLRTYTRAGLLDKKLVVSGGYRSNLFDPVYNSDVSIRHTADFGAQFAFHDNGFFFTECGIIGLGTGPDAVVPLLAGITMGIKPWLDGISLELEYEADRDERPLLWNVFLWKKLGKRVQFDWGLFSDPNGLKTMDLGTGLRFSCTLN